MEEIKKAKQARKTRHEREKPPPPLGGGANTVPSAPSSLCFLGDEAELQFTQWQSVGLQESLVLGSSEWKLLMRARVHKSVWLASPFAFLFYSLY